LKEGVVADTGAPKQGYVDLPEGQIHYRTAGTGPPLLLLHLTTFSSDLFADVMPLLAARYRVIAMDRFGHGTSDPLPPSVSAEGLAGTVVSFLDALDVDDTFVLGQHTGTVEALEMALAHPRRVRKLVLVATPDWSEDSRAEGARTLRAMYPDMDGSHMARMWRQRSEWASPSTTPQIMHRVVMAALYAMGNSPDIAKAMQRHHVTERLPLLEVPTLFLAGEHDHMRVHLDRHRSFVPSTTPTELAIIEGAGAFAALEKPQEFARVVMDYLGS
jgi:pimeloyl-ACP methyl ester carboxylesterase